MKLVEIKQGNKTVFKGNENECVKFLGKTGGFLTYYKDPKKKMKDFVTPYDIYIDGRKIEKVKSIKKNYRDTVKKKDKIIIYGNTYIVKDIIKKEDTIIYIVNDKEYVSKREITLFGLDRRIRRSL